MAVRRRRHGAGDDRARGRHPADRLGTFDYGMGSGPGCVAADQQCRVAASVRPLSADSAVRPGERRLRPCRVQADLLAGVGPSSVGPTDRSGVPWPAGLVLGNRSNRASAARLARPALPAWGASGPDRLDHGRLRLPAGQHRRIAISIGDPPRARPDAVLRPGVDRHDRAAAGARPGRLRRQAARNGPAVLGIIGIDHRDRRLRRRHPRRLRLQHLPADGWTTRAPGIRASGAAAAQHHREHCRGAVRPPVAGNCDHAHCWPSLWRLDWRCLCRGSRASR